MKMSLAMRVGVPLGIVGVSFFTVGRLWVAIGARTDWLLDPAHPDRLTSVTTFWTAVLAFLAIIGIIVMVTVFFKVWLGSQAPSRDQIRGKQRNNDHGLVEGHADIGHVSSLRNAGSKFAQATRKDRAL